MDTFSGWVEVYPTRTEKATEVVKLFHKEIIPKNFLTSFGVAMDHCSLWRSPIKLDRHCKCDEAACTLETSVHRKD